MNLIIITNKKKQYYTTNDVEIIPSRYLIELIKM